MRPDLPWNVVGIPPEAREAARVAARRDGLSVGEWLTRRILRSFSDGNTDIDELSRRDWPTPERDDERPGRSDTEEMLAHVSRTEADAQSANRKIEEQLRTFARRMDASERSQSEHIRALNKAAAEINSATREQAHAFDQLGSNVAGLFERIDRVERQAASDGIKEAVKGLHQGLARLADQMSQSAGNSAMQISALADNLEAIAGKLSTTKLDSDSTARRMESRNVQFEERLRRMEKLVDASATEVARVSASSAAITRLEETLARVESRSSDTSLDRRLSSVERALVDVAGREASPPTNTPIEDGLKILGQRVDATEKSLREALNELRETMAQISKRNPEPQDAPVAPVGFGGAMPQPYVPDMPTIAGTGNMPPNVPTFQSSPAAFLTPFSPEERSPPADTIPQAANVAAEEPEPVVDSFLAAARRSAQAAAAQAEADRLGRGLGGFAWGSQLKPRSEPPPARFALIGLIALAIVLLAVAGILFSDRFPTHSRTPVEAAVPARTSAPIVLKPSTPQGEAVSVPKNSPSSAPAEMAPSPSAPAPRNAPSSPALPMLKPREAATTAGKPALENKAPHVLPPLPVPHTAPMAPAQRTATMPALDRLTALANSGNAKAETIVGLRYLEGNGVPTNEGEAAKWLQRAAERGQAVAQYRLGTLYERGRGVPADGAKAIHWYQAAAQAGNRKAMHNLAVACAQGTGLPKDFFEAARWFSKAAALGLADSQFNLAVLYERGLGVPQSLLDAYKWYAIAASQGDAESKARIDAIATQLSADDRAAAQRSADQFKPARLDANANVPPQLADIAG